MMNAYFDFVKGACEFEGQVVSNGDQSVLLVANCGTCSEKEIIPAYEKYGTDCVSHLEGVFSFCLYDSSKKQLFVARDRIGEKSVYYSQLPTGFAFSSELKDILPKIKYPAINAHAFAEGIRYNYPIELQQTWIEQIKRLRAGEYAIVDAGGLRLHTYWKRNHTPSFKGTKQDAIQETLRLMRQSVRRCIETANGPVAVLLSGGIDSSSLAAFAKEIQQEVHVICAGYKGNNYKVCDERDAARRFAEEKGLIYHEVELDVNDFKNLLDELTPYLDEPCFDVSCMSQFALYRKAAEMGFKVILSGLGGDEQFYSYKYHHKVVEALQLNREFYQLYPIRKHKIEYVKYLLRNWKHLLMPNHPVMMDESIPLAWTYNDYMKFSSDAVFCDDKREIAFKDVDVHCSFPQNTDILKMYDFMFASFAVNMCVYLGNRLCGANGVELRCPLLDSALVAFLDSLPIDMKFDVTKPKQFQKDVMAGIVPDYILYAKKRGFEPPFEFIWKMCGQYQYKHLKSNHVFFNSMMADQMINNLIK